MDTQVKIAAEFFSKACQAEARQELDLAEVYYLKSASVFEKSGDSQLWNAANALNALAILRRARGDVDGALRTAKRSMWMMEGRTEKDAEFMVIRATAWELTLQLTGLGETDFGLMKG